MENAVQESLKIEDMIFEVRDKQVMLDRELAKLYQCTNRKIPRTISQPRSHI